MPVDGRTGRRTDRHAEGQKDTQKDRWTGRRTEGHSNGQIDTQTDRRTLKRTDGQADGQIHGQKDRQTDRWSGRWTNGSPDNKKKMKLVVELHLCQLTVGWEERRKDGRTDNKRTLS